MIKVVLIMTAGILVGYLLRSKKRLILGSEKMTIWAIYLLLFLLGVAIGSDERIVQNLPKLGWEAFLLTIGGVAGSIILASLTYRFFFNHQHEKAKGVKSD